MAASPQVVDAAPLFLTGLQNTYNAKDFREAWAEVLGQGVLDFDSFRIRQRLAGATMSVDCQTPSIQNVAWIRNTTAATDGGLYRAHFNSATQTNLDIAAADPTNPRIDQVFLCVEDSQDTGSNNQATVRIVTGTPTGGATLDNRTGVGATPTGMSSMLLADILVAAAAGSIVNANIRDRRGFAVLGSTPSTFTALDMVSFQPAPGLFASSNIPIQSTANFDAQQGAALMFLPRRIVGATRIRLKYVQGATANTANFGLGIYDASGRQMVLTTPAAYTGTANQQVSASLTIGATTFEAGYYWVWQGNAAGTASATVTALATPGSTSSYLNGPNLFAYATSGGTTAPTTILAMTDLWSITAAAVVIRLGVPIVSLSVG